jgi:hypothetical protein
MRILLIIFIVSPLQLWAQFDPAGGKNGSKAVHRNHASISYWGDSIRLELGNTRINSSTPIIVSTGEVADAIGHADNRTVSLGDNGRATYFFERAIANIEGPDFVVFENGFDWVGGYFLELAFVEVSSDGSRFVRFPALSAADTTVQIENLAYMEPEWYYNLAGKHQAPYGTPFDLNELKDSLGLDVTAISHVRLVDVVGSINDSFVRRDVNKVKINDPWPTDFASGGFDLDAIGVLQFPLAINQLSSIKRLVAPNPHQIQQGFDVLMSYQTLSIINMKGELVYSDEANNNHIIPQLLPGIYALRLESGHEIYTQKICVTR